MLLSYTELPDNALLAVSGGGDSVALAHLYQTGHISAAIGHVRHGTSEWQFAAERFVQNLAQELDSPFFSVEVAVQTRGGQGYEAKCRKLRYAALAELVARNNLSVLVTAHTRDDFAETVAIAIQRRQGIAALAGIPEQRVLCKNSEKSIHLVRPFLHTTRNELRHWMKSLGVKWIEDPTNGNPTFALRNAIRNEWSKLSPVGYEAKLIEMEAVAEKAKERWNNAENALETVFPDWTETTGQAVAVPSHLLTQLDDDALQVFFTKVARKFGLEAGAFSRGHRSQFAAVLHSAKWGARGMLGRRLAYRLTKRECRFTEM